MKISLILVSVIVLVSFVSAAEYNYDINAQLADSGVDADLNVNVDVNNVEINEDGSVSADIDVKTSGKVNGQEIRNRDERQYQIQANRNGSANVSVTLPNGNVVTRTIEREGNKTKVNMYINGEQVREGYQYKSENGSREITVKIMPSVASETAIARLRLKVCSEENNCTIEFKEVGQGNKTELRYEVKALEQRRFLGLFKRNITVSAEVDAETGEVVEVKRKPFWYF